MKWLLDTHVLLWLAEGSDQIPPRARKRLEATAATSGLAVSAISFWEVAMLGARGRISLTVSPADWRRRVLAQAAIIEAPVGGDVGIEAVVLPGALHADPADRLLVATARINGWALATRDRRLLRYAEDGHVHAVEI